MESGLDRRAAWYGGGVARDDGIVCVYRCCCTLCGSKHPADGGVSREPVCCACRSRGVSQRRGPGGGPRLTITTRRCARSAQRSIEEWQAARSGQALAWRAQRFIARRSCRVLTTPARARCARLPPLASPHALAGLTLAAAKPTRRLPHHPPGLAASFPLSLSIVRHLTHSHPRRIHHRRIFTPALFTTPTTPARYCTSTRSLPLALSHLGSRSLALHMLRPLHSSLPI